MNKKKLKMAYVGVLSSQPSLPAYRSTFKYFNKYLITLGEPTASSTWNMLSILRHAENILIHEKIPGNTELLVDSGGYQAIVGKITKNRILEYIECYHFVLDKYHVEIDKIFSLDINNFQMTADEILEWNYKSTQMTIDSIKKYPVLKDKVLFVLQNRNRRVFEIWRKLFIEKKAWEHFDLYSIGGLVGLKKATNVDFNHAVPATLWLMTYAKKHNFEIKQMHWLGQSSKVVFIAMALLEKLYGIYFTSDSSELIRFAPIVQKLPLIQKMVAYDDKSSEFKDDFRYARTKSDAYDMLAYHSWDDDNCPRASRDNFKELDIDIDIFNVVNQDILDYLLLTNIEWGPNYFNDMAEYAKLKNIKSKATEHEARQLKYSIQQDILVDLKNCKSTVVEVCETLVKIFTSGTLDQGDLKLIKYTLDDALLAEYNLNYVAPGSDPKKFEKVELQNFYIYLEKLRNFKYQNQRSTIAQDIFEKNKFERLDNCDYIELMCQHVDNAMIVSDVITDKLLELGLEKCTTDVIKTMHPILDQGRTAKTVYENIQWILKFKEVIEEGNTDRADNIMRDLVDSYE